MIICRKQLLTQTIFTLILACILFSCLTVVTFAEVGDTKKQIEQKYGSYFIVEDSAHQFWTPAEWQNSSDRTAKSYGYMTPSGGLNQTIWVEYNSQDVVTKETTLVDGSIKIRNFKNYFSELHNQIIAPNSIVLTSASAPNSSLAVIIQNPAGKYNLITFFLDNDSQTKINMHTKIRGFEISAAPPSIVKTYMKKGEVTNPDPSATTVNKTYPPEEWVITGNFFRPELYFSEILQQRKKTDMIVIHHTAIDNVSVADIHEMHLAKGWAGIGYHKVILPDGVVQNGRPENAIGSHALGANKRSIGISLVGNFETSLPTSQQLDALVTLTLELMAKYHVPLENVVPHRAVTQGTVCPGTLFPWDQFIHALKEKSSNLK
ncbi:MAG: N-acetylmuramyl-L-alanine amidase, negative regulator of AmpC, AmpD [Firmicutes bacterium]|nr:N-acetylmuramyl-L-alanine amidase, negative regulator of AmpC, AmpD [Bacillota bacterium]